MERKGVSRRIHEYEAWKRPRAVRMDEVEHAERERSQSDNVVAGLQRERPRRRRRKWLWCLSAVFMCAGGFRAARGFSG